MSVNIESVNPDDIPDDSKPNTDGVTLNKDGTPRKRRGRPPGSAASGGRRTAADRKQVEQALATMETLYSSITAAMLVFGKPNTAELIATRAEQTQKANRQAFEASPVLAGSIAKLGAVSSVGLFLGANASLLAQAFMTFRLEAAMQNAMREQEPKGNDSL